MGKRVRLQIHSLKLTAGRRSAKSARRARRAIAWQIQFLPQFGPRQTVNEQINTKLLAWLALAVGLLFVLVAYQLFNLQIVNGSRYSGLAEGNRLRSKITYAPRGRILDRNGAVL